MTKKHTLKQKKILVTGGTGTIGKSLMPVLLSNKFNCLMISKKTNLRKSIINIHCDITDFEKLNKIINEQKPDIIIHLAAITGNINCEKNPKKHFLQMCWELLMY